MVKDSLDNSLGKSRILGRRGRKLRFCPSWKMGLKTYSFPEFFFHVTHPGSWVMSLEKTLQFWGRRDDDDAEKRERKGMTPRWLEGRDKRRQLFQGRRDRVEERKKMTLSGKKG